MCCCEHFLDLLGLGYVFAHEKEILSCWFEFSPLLSVCVCVCMYKLCIGKLTSFISQEGLCFRWGQPIPIMEAISFLQVLSSGLTEVLKIFDPRTICCLNLGWEEEGGWEFGLVGVQLREIVYYSLTFHSHHVRSADCEPDPSLGLDVSPEQTAS